MSDILNKILAVKADEVAAAKKYRDLASLRREVEGDASLRAAATSSALTARILLRMSDMQVLVVGIRCGVSWPRRAGA